MMTRTAEQHRDGLLISISNAEAAPLRTIELAYNSNVRLEQELLRYGQLEEIDLAINRLTCARCHEDVPLGSMFLETGTVVYTASRSMQGFLVCHPCDDIIEKDPAKEWVAYEWQTKGRVVEDYELRHKIDTTRTRAGGFIPKSVESKQPAAPPKVETPKEFITRLTGYLNTSVRSTFKTSCSHGKGYNSGSGDHLDFLDLPKYSGGGIAGDLILSGSWSTGAQALPEADAAIFFAESWKTKYQPQYTPEIPDEIIPFETVWNEGSNGLTWPSVDVIKKGKPGTEQKPWPEQAPIIYIPWPDHGVLPIDIVAPYVDAAADFIRAGKVVQIGCIGGHGRTGTFAAMVVANLFPNWGAQWSLNWVRFFYCPKAAEVNPQEDMVFTYTGEEPPPTPSKSGIGTQGSLLYPPSTSSQTPSVQGKPNPNHSYANK